VRWSNLTSQIMRCPAGAAFARVSETLFGGDLKGSSPIKAPSYDLRDSFRQHRWYGVSDLPILGAT